MPADGDVHVLLNDHERDMPVSYRDIEQPYRLSCVNDRVSKLGAARRWRRACSRNMSQSQVAVGWNPHIIILPRSRSANQAQVTADPIVLYPAS